MCQYNTTWMWASQNGGTQGLIINIEDQRLHWFEDVGCACGDSSRVQTYKNFLQHSAPLFVPADILHEIRETVTALDSQEEPIT